MQVSSVPNASSVTILVPYSLKSTCNSISNFRRILHDKGIRDGEGISTVALARKVRNIVNATVSLDKNDIPIYTWSKQPADLKGKMTMELAARFPWLLHFENNWGAEFLCHLHIKNKMANARRQKGVSERTTVHSESSPSFAGKSYLV